MRDDPTSAALRIARLARRWRRERWAAWVAAAACLAAAAWLISGIAALTAVAALVPLVGALANHRRRPINPVTVARHLDRTVSTLEESAALLLDGDGIGDPLQRMQRRRAAAAFAEVAVVPRLRAPTTRMAVLVCSACLMIAALVLVIPERIPASPGAPGTAGDSANDTPLRIGSITLQWTAPAYLGRDTRTAPAAHATVEEGSVVQWQVDAAGAALVRIVDLLGDTLAARQAGEQWLVTTTVTRAKVWRAEAQDHAGNFVRSDAHLLSVTPDRPPVIAIVAPPGRTEMDWTESHRVVIRAVVSDDYAIGTTALLATVAAGRGEGVRFRERRLPLERESSLGPREQVVSAMIDLDMLDVAPGDEVYLAVEASDRRAPQPQLSRSETVFLAIRDTLDPVSSDFGGIAIDIEPEFFRSQRQIILDTEALLADVRSGKIAAPLARAMEIGYDQYLLRVRYGEIAGQQDEIDGAAADASITEADLIHQHDTEDNATLLAASVKATLQSALAAMWEAEKQLRTGQPTAALPHEYRALVALEQIRQAQRAYVKRIGFEPAAIDVARTRLTKQAKDLAPFERRTLPINEATGGELLAALSVIGAPEGPVRSATLDAAARQLAESALDDVTGQHLETLGALRRLLDGDTTVAVQDRVRSGLLAALPAPPRPIVPFSPR